MRFLYLFLLLIFSNSVFSACSLNQFRLSYKPLQTGILTAHYYGSTSTNKSFYDANVAANSIGINCDRIYSGFLQNCYHIGTSIPATSNGQIQVLGPSLCFEDEENKRNCDKYGSNGGGMILEKTAPLLCMSECEIKKVGSSTPVFGHSTGGGQSVYSYTGEICPSPPHEKLSPTNETGQGESCKLIDGIRFCDVPDIDGDGLPEIPTPPDMEGCSSVTNVSTGAHTVSCNDDFPDGNVSDDQVCGYVDTRFACVDKDQCTFVDGQTVCVDNSGNYVGTDNADNPMNGGNLDGDNTNDIVSPTQNITSPILTDDQVVNNQNSSNLLEESLAPYLVDIDNSVKTNGEKIDASNVLLTSIASGITDLNANGGGGGVSGPIDIDETGTPDPIEFSNQLESDQFFSDLETALGDETNPSGYGESMGDTSLLTNKLGINITDSCTDVSYTIYQDYSWTLKCSHMTLTRNIIAWVFWFFTIYSLFNIAMDTQRKLA